MIWLTKYQTNALTVALAKVNVLQRQSAKQTENALLTQINVSAAEAVLLYVL